MNKKVFLEKGGFFSINGYKHPGFYYDRKLNHDFYKSLKIPENVDYVKDNDFDYTYYKINGENITFRHDINKYKLLINNKPNELKYKIHSSKFIMELILIILDDEKIKFLSKKVLITGPEKSLSSILTLLSYFISNEGIRERIIDSYILELSVK